MLLHVRGQHEVDDGGTQPSVIKQRQVVQKVAAVTGGHQDSKRSCTVVVLLQVRVRSVV